MNPTFLFFNSAGRLRSGWRLVIFLVFFLACVYAGWRIVAGAIFLVAGQRAFSFLSGFWGTALQRSIILFAAIFCSWACGRLLEGLPFTAVGWSPHKGWLRDLLLGSAVGAVSLILATCIATVFGGFHFSLDSASASAITRTIVVSLAVYVFFAAWEEALFRGYPLQTMTRAHLAWVAILLSSALFAQGHLNNPNVVPGFTFVNTALAGIWLAVAYLRTRSLWFPLGLHWSWNWMMGSVLGLPVSGISRVSPHPLLNAVDAGPAWLTGGSYGIEGGAACTLILVISIIWIWKTRLLGASEEMLELSEHENAGGGGLKLGKSETRVEKTSETLFP
jgi:membrane protease YdiL (CAAX protease family)